MADTPNFGLNRPAKGSSDWHVPLNENSETIDGRLPIVDTDGNRSLYSPNDGQLYVAYDTGKLFRYDASSTSWVQINQHGSKQNPVEQGHYKKVVTEKINNTRVVRPSSWDDLKTIIENTNTDGEWDVIRIPAGWSIKGPGPSSPITIDPTDPSGNERRLRLLASETDMEATAQRNGTPLFEIPPNDSEDARIELHFGNVSGYATSPSSSQLLRGTDVTNVTVTFSAIRKMYRGIEINLDNGWSEEWTIEGDSITANDGCVYINGDPNWYSVQGLRIDTRMAMFGPAPKTGIRMDGGNISFSECVVRSKIFTNESDEVALLWNSVGGGVWQINVDGSGNATAIKCGTDGAANDPELMVVNAPKVGTLFDESNGAFNYWYKRGGKMVRYQGNSPVFDFHGAEARNFVVESGRSGNRPSNPDTGQEYFDTDLGHAIHWDGSQWVDGSGSSVS